MKVAVGNERAGHCRTARILELLGARTTMTVVPPYLFPNVVQFTRTGVSSCIEPLVPKISPLLPAMELVDTVHNHEVEVSISPSWLAPRMSSCQAVASKLAATCTAVGTYHCLLAALVRGPDGPRYQPNNVHGCFDFFNRRASRLGFPSCWNLRHENSIPVLGSTAVQCHTFQVPSKNRAIALIRLTQKPVHTFPADPTPSTPSYFVVCITTWTRLCPQRREA